MNIIHCLILFLLHVYCLAGPIEDLATMPDLSLFYQQIIRQQDIQMLLQGLFPQQTSGGVNDFTIFAPNNDAMINLNRKNEDLSVLWKYHIVPGRYDEQMLFSMAQEKYNQASPQQMLGIRVQNNLPTVALPFQVYYGVGFYGGTGPQINETFDNAGYGAGGISWLTHTSFNQTNRFENNIPMNPFIVDNFNRNQQHLSGQGNAIPAHRNQFRPNMTNYFGNVFNPNVNVQSRQGLIMPNMNMYPNYQQQQQQPLPPPQGYGQFPTNTGIGVLRPTINNAFLLQSRPMSRGVINVIDNILWPPERRDQVQYKTAYDALEDGQFSRLRQLAERSEYFRSELRSINQQTWFLPNDQAFASMGSSLSYLLDQTSINNTNEINEFINAHVVPLVLFPVAMDSTKKVSTFNANRWITFRKVTEPDQSFQVDVISGRYVARILVSRPEDIRFYGNGVVYPISTILTAQIRPASDELLRSYQYFINIVQQSGDLELMNLLQGTSGQNIFNPQNSLNITVLIPQQMLIQQLGSGQELSMNLRRHIIPFPIYVEPQISNIGGSNYFTQQSMFQNGQQQSFGQAGFNQRQPSQIPQFQRTGPGIDKKLPRRRRRRQQQANLSPNTNYQQKQFPQQQMLNQPLLPNQQILPNHPPQMLPNQQQQMLLNQQQQILLNQQQSNPNFYQTSSYPTSATFQNDQTYPTLDPQFTLRAQVSAGTRGPVVTLIGRSANSLPFSATVINAESNLPIKNGVMHVIRGILSGMIIPIEGVLTSVQGANAFTQLLMQTGVIEQLKQSNRPYTLFIPTNAALQSMGVTRNGNLLRQFVLRHICADVLLDPMNNVLRRSAGYYNRPQNALFKRPRQKRQDWMNSQRNRSNIMNRQGFQSPNIAQGYFQPQQQSYGGYPASSTPFGSNNQLYNSGYAMNGNAASNSQYFPGFNGSYFGNQNNIYNTMGMSNQPFMDNTWNRTMNMPVNRQMIPPSNGKQENYFTSSNTYFGATASSGGPQSCTAMTGERIIVQSLEGPQSDGNTPSMSYQNFIVTCCGDQSVNSMVQSFNVYAPNYAVYVLGRPLISQGQTINTMYMSNYSSKLVPSSFMFIIFIISLIFDKIHQF
ncbi:unnamed protein product [Adineta ricciae]|uniref:FAS1 domain-containing protein n=1 Tax=Adineta ricciae TaxID=249248 RepID=A0A814UR77_ADIRI|nr:unnamed protein product [Adineta ricciae]CAF1177798.1 unnamed protein product [Adineta ricciae]